MSLAKLHVNFNSIISGDADDWLESKEKKIVMRQDQVMQDMYSECKTEEDLDE